MSNRSDARGHLVNRGGWWEHVNVDTLPFNTEPTANGDDEAEYMRDWYEANRETWWDRMPWGHGGPGRAWADEFMLALTTYATRLSAAADKARRCRG